MVHLLWKIKASDPARPAIIIRCYHDAGRVNYTLTTRHHELLDLRNRLRGIQSLRTGLRAIHDGVAAIETEWILEIVEALARRLVAAVGDPAIRLQQDCRTEIPVAVPPIARAARGAAEAEDAFP